MGIPLTKRQAAGGMLVAVLCLLLAACAQDAPQTPVGAAKASTTDTATGLPFGKGGAVFLSQVTTSITGTVWSPPTEADIPADSVGASVRRGLALLRNITDSLPAYAPGHMNCTNCHLQDGRARYGSPLIGAFARYPRYIQRSAAVVTIADRVNFCITRSLAGSRLPTDSREMADMVMYLAWLSKGLPLGMQTPGGSGLPKLTATQAPDPVRGAQLYVAKCQSCHQADGGGIRAASTASSVAPASVPTSIPPLWGQASYSVGASMARVERAASFIAHNMPFGQAGTLTTQEAFDVAAYINAKPRPDLPGKENDWPAGGEPADLPYSIKSGHMAVNSPPLLPRRNPARAVVPAPPRAGSMK